MSDYTFENPKNVLFFDMNNTIVDKRKTLKLCFFELVEELTARWSDATDLNPSQLWARYQAEFARGGGSLSARAHHLNCLRKALQALPISTSEQSIRKLDERLQQLSRGRVVPYDDAVETINALGKSYRIGIISNGNRRKQWSQLNKLKLAAQIPQDHIIVSPDGIRKPNPAIFHKALHKLGVKPEECVMIGDSWRNDVAGAARAGIDAIWINRKGTKKQPSPSKLGKAVIVTVSNLADLNRIL